MIYYSQREEENKKDKERREEDKMTYWFEDMVSGEEFFVEEITRENAFKIAYQYFKEPHFIDTVTNEEAEMMGLDTY